MPERRVDSGAPDGPSVARSEWNSGAEQAAATIINMLVIAKRNQSKSRLNTVIARVGLSLVFTIMME